MKNLSQEQIKNEIFYGEIVDINDPYFEGRCKINIFGITDEVNKEDLPWSMPGGFCFLSSDGGANISIPKLGTIVKVKFPNGDIYNPVWFEAGYISEEIKKEISQSYEGAQVLLWDKDEKIKIYYTKKAGLNIWFGESKFVINSDKSITIEHEGSKSIIEFLGDELNIVTQNNINISAPQEIVQKSKSIVVNGSQKVQLGPKDNMSAVGAEALFSFLKALATAVDAKYPATPGVNAGLAEQAEKLATSKIVKLSVP